MGNACSACFRPPPPPSGGPASIPTTKSEKDAYAREMAALAAQQRADKFEKSPVGRAAKTAAAAAAAKPSSNRPGEPVLKWQMGS